MTSFSLDRTSILNRFFFATYNDDKNGNGVDVVNDEDDDDSDDDSDDGSDDDGDDGSDDDDDNSDDDNDDDDGATFDILVKYFGSVRELGRSII